MYFFWCFSFERFNGILGKFNNNNKQTIEIQIMRQFQQNQQPSMLWTYMELNILQGQVVGTLSRDDTTDKLYVKQNVLENCTVVPLSPFHRIIMDEHDRHAMLMMYHQMYHENCIIEVDRFGMICKRVTHLNVTYSTKGSRAERSAYVYAKWCANTNSFEEPITDPLSEPRPAIIKQFLIVNVMSKGAAFIHVGAKVSWLHPHPD